MTLDCAGAVDGPGGELYRVEVYVSRDGEAWGGPIAGVEGRAGLTAISFEPQMARYCKIVQVGTQEWALADLRAYMDRSASD